MYLYGAQEIARTTLLSVAFLCLLLLSPLLVDIVNIWRAPRDRLLSVDEVVNVSPLLVRRLLACSACQVLWATIAAAALVLGTWRGAGPLAAVSYVPALCLWLGVRRAYYADPPR